MLFAADGLSFTLARIGLLDIFLQTFVIVAVACLVVDRDRVRERVRAAGDRLTDTGFRLGPRGWRLAAGLLLRLLLRGEVERDLLPRPLRPPVAVLGPRRPGARPACRTPPGRRSAAGCPGAAWALGAVPLLTYLASFTGWFLGETSQGKFWAQQHPHTAFPFVPDALRSLWHQHAEWLTFHNGLSQPAPVAVQPLVVADRRAADPAVEPAGAHRRRRRPDRPLHPDGRARRPSGSPSRRRCCWLIWRIVARRDPAAILVATAIVAGWVTWFVNLDRTMFIFYMAPAVPFFVLAITLALQDVIGPRDAAGRWTGDVLRRQVGPRRGVPLRGRRGGDVRLLLPGARRQSPAPGAVGAADVVPVMVLTGRLANYIVGLYN